MGSDSDIDGDFGSGSDSDFNPIAVEEGSNVDAANDVDAEFMDELEAENSAEVSTTSVSLKGRKKVRHEENWARNARKKNRNMGLVYLNSKNVLVNKKTHQLIDKNCHDLCYQKISEDQQKKIFDDYYKIGNFDLQTSYLCELISVSDKKKCYKYSVSKK